VLPTGWLESVGDWPWGGRTDACLRCSDSLADRRRRTAAGD
jgi:hypothetical protein